MKATIPVSSETNQARGRFFRGLFGTSQGYICIAVLDSDRKMQQRFFKYPDELGSLLEFVNQVFQGSNIYFCPQLLRGHERSKGSVLICTCVWADLDYADPRLIDPQPSIVVETSPNRYHGYWLLDHPVDPVDAEDASRRIAYKYQDLGVDKSGWDLTQLLRVPYTYNEKHADGDGTPVVVIVPELSTGERHSIEVFKTLDQVPGFEVLDDPMPDVSGMDPTSILEKHRSQLDPVVITLYSVEPRGDWSAALWNLESLLLESGLTREETFVVAQNAACNKFARDGRPASYVWKDVCRAALRVDERARLTIGKYEAKPLLSDEELELVKSAPRTFVDEYVDWAKGRGDAAWQYHEAGAFTILSHLLSASVTLPTSFGIMKLNLWFMILADTTLTRKSTAMDMAMDLLLQVDADAVLATDGSLEGLMQSISTRPNRPGIFWRDEFSGLLEAMKKKDYLAGMMEALTKLYDGKYQKRILRKDIIEVRDPILIMLCGGIRSRVLELMDLEHIVSGFTPRFIFISALSDISNYKPIGPMTSVQDSRQGELVRQLADLHDRYRTDIAIKIGNQNLKTNQPIEAHLSPEAWDRYNKLEMDMVQEGIESGMPEVYTPTMDRLAKSGLKVAVILACCRQSPQDGKVRVELLDMLKAATYLQRWRQYSADVVANAGKTTNERRLDNIVSAISRKPGITRSQVMQNFHLSAREADWVLETLDQRGIIRQVPFGRTKRLYPAHVR